MNQIADNQGTVGTNQAVQWDVLIKKCEHHMPIEHHCEECEEEKHLA